MQKHKANQGNWIHLPRIWFYNTPKEPEASRWEFLEAYCDRYAPFNYQDEIFFDGGFMGSPASIDAPCSMDAKDIKRRGCQESLSIGWWISIQSHQILAPNMDKPSF